MLLDRECHEEVNNGGVLFCSAFNRNNAGYRLVLQDFFKKCFQDIVITLVLFQLAL